MTNRNSRLTIWLKDTLPRHGFKTQQDFAREIGVRPETVSCWMHGRTVPDGPSRLAMAEALGVSREFIDDLLDSYGPPTGLASPIQDIVDRLAAMPDDVRDDAILLVKIALRLIERRDARERNLLSPPDPE